MSNEDRLRAVANNVREAKEDVTKAILKLRAEGQTTGMYELEMAQRALFSAEMTVQKGEIR